MFVGRCKSIPFVVSHSLYHAFKAAPRAQFHDEVDIVIVFNDSVQFGDVLMITCSLVYRCFRDNSFQLFSVTALLEDGFDGTLLP